jgi:hypothetical protein
MIVCISRPLGTTGPPVAQHYLNCLGMYQEPKTNGQSLDGITNGVVLDLAQTSCWPDMPAVAQTRELNC